MRQQMRQGGSSSPSCPSTSDCFSLTHLSADQCGSENLAEPEKSEVRANNIVSTSQRLTRQRCDRKPLLLHDVELSSVCVEERIAFSLTALVDKPTKLSRMSSLVMFYACYLLCLCLGLSCVVCVCVWNSKWRGGFAWDGSLLQFNWHPVLMVTGLVVVYGIGAVLYRIPLTWGQNKLPWKLLHAALMLIALVLSIVGLCAVFDYHNAHNISNVYSLHSWIGIVAAALFAMQWAFGAAAFLLPCIPLSLRKLLKPTHVWFGGSVVLLSVAACISGINEKLFFALKGNATGTQPYSELPPEAVLGNALGVLIVAFGLVVLKILSNPKWQRPDSRPGDLAYAPLLQEENE